MDMSKKAIDTENKIKNIENEILSQNPDRSKSRTMSNPTVHFSADKSDLRDALIKKSS
jgi:hypothetical protein